MSPENPTAAGSPSEAVALAASLLVHYSDSGWVPLLAAHVNDGSGHCRSCRGSIWPCTLWAIAQRARTLAHRRAR